MSRVFPHPLESLFPHMGEKKNPQFSETGIPHPGEKECPHPLENGIPHLCFVCCPSDSHGEDMVTFPPSFCGFYRIRH
jgi:hypothetical protein